MSRKAFTLIELLIVVAIIAILAAIAVPNFLEAQTRAKTSRSKADMRSLATGLESYVVDNNAYPLCNNFSLSGARFDPNEQAAGTNEARRVLERLSTPVAYLTSGFLPDPFAPTTRRSSFSVAAPQGTATTMQGSDANFPSLTNLVKYVALNPTATSGFADVEGLDGPAKTYLLHAAGPFRSYPALGSLFQLNNPATDRPAAINQVYDPTNGTVSYGYIFRKSAGSDAAYGSLFLSTIGN